MNERDPDGAGRNVPKQGEAASSRAPGEQGRTSGREARPEGRESETWQDHLREQADTQSAGSDEAAANTAEAEPPRAGGLHGGLVPPTPR